jgi:hypothetical protein
LSISDIESLHKHWRFLALDYDEDFRDTYKMIHQAVQFLAITNKSILPPRFDDSHTSFTWDFRKNCFSSEWLQAKKTFRLEFYPLDLCLSLVPYGEDPLDSMYLIGKTKKEVYAQLRHMLAIGGIEVIHFSTDMHYDLPEHRVCKGGKYQIMSQNIHEEIVKHYSNAHIVLNILKGKNPLTSSIRCWPHHFDIAADFQAVDESGKNSLGFSIGFSPANPDLPEPHYYFILRQDNRNISRRKNKLQYGRWLPRNIYGTSLGLKYLLKKTSIKSQVEILSGYLNESYGVVLDQIIPDNTRNQLVSRLQ